MKSKTLRRIRALIESFDATEALGPIDLKDAEKCLKKIQRGIRESDAKTIESGVSELAAVFLRSANTERD